MDVRGREAEALEPPPRLARREAAIEQHAAACGVGDQAIALAAAA
jgi:hypothetical protein